MVHCDVSPFMGTWGKNTYVLFTVWGLSWITWSPFGVPAPQVENPPHEHIEVCALTPLGLTIPTEAGAERGSRRQGSLSPWESLEGFFVPWRENLKIGFFRINKAPCWVIYNRMWKQIQKGSTPNSTFPLVRHREGRTMAGCSQGGLTLPSFLPALLS